MADPVFSFGNLELPIADVDVRPVELTSAEVVTLSEDINLTRVTAAHTLAVDDLNAAMRGVQSLRQLSHGLEAIMYEIDSVEDKDNPTKEELDVIRIAASAVVHDGLSEDESVVIEKLIEGNLTGSQEGLLDVINSVGKKITFTVGNIAEKIGHAFASLDGADKLAESAKRLREKVNGYPVGEYEATFDGGLIDKIAVAGQLNLLKDFETLPEAFINWFDKPIKAAPSTLNKIISIVEKALNANNEKEFKQYYQDILTFDMPKSPSAKLVDSIKTRYGMNDIYAEPAIAGGWQKAYMIPRASTDGDSDSHNKAVDHAYRLANYEVAMARLNGKRKFVPKDVKVSKGDVLKIIDIAENIGIDLQRWASNRTTMATMNKTYNRAAGKFVEFEKKSWVGRKTAHEARILLYAALSVFSFTFTNGYCIYTGGLTAKAAVTKLIYGTDLSGAKG